MRYLYNELSTFEWIGITRMNSNSSWQTNLIRAHGSFRLHGLSEDVLRKLRHNNYEEEKQLLRDKPRKGKHKVTYGEKIKWLKEERQKSNQ